MPSSSITFVLLSSAWELASQYISLLTAQTCIHADLDENNTTLLCNALAVSWVRGNPDLTHRSQLRLAALGSDQQEVGLAGNRAGHPAAMPPVCGQQL